MEEAFDVLQLSNLTRRREDATKKSRRGDRTRVDESRRGAAANEACVWQIADAQQSTEGRRRWWRRFWGFKREDSPSYPLGL